MRWMNLELIIQSEVSLNEKEKSPILTRIYMESRKTVLMNLFAGQQWRNRDNRLRDTGEGEEGRG